jgi:uncharacterized protein YbbC (DUF1343 family)
MQILFRKNTNLIAFCLLINALFYLAKSQTCILNYSAVTTGAQQTEKYLPLLKGKRVAVLTNISGTIGKTSIVDTLLSLKIKVVKVFGPEHGFRGNTEAGDKVANDKDIKTGLPIISLYGNNKRPSQEQLKDVDIVLFDIQDVGVRFYTYISTMCYAMEACAEMKKEFVVLDRPNPNGFYIDGPVMENKYMGFLGLHKVPIVYGLTIGEYAIMANKEGWLKKKITCNLKVIPLQNYKRTCSYELPVPPSPNLPTIQSILLYPSLGLFEGTKASVGRGTDLPFQVVGITKPIEGTYTFMPTASMVSNNPKHKSLICYGLNLSENIYLSQHPGKIEIKWLIQLAELDGGNDFFDKNFNSHCGNDTLVKQIYLKQSEAAIRKSWQKSIDQYKKIRSKYLLYPDF